MKRLIVLLSACALTGIVCPACADKSACKETGGIVLENDQFRLVIGSNAVAESLILKATGEECLMQGENMPIFSVTQDRPYHNE